MPNKSEDNQKGLNKNLEIDQPFETPDVIASDKKSQRQYVLEIKLPETKDITPEVVGLKGALERDATYTEILQAYLENYKEDKKVVSCQKKAFFWLVIVLFGLVFLLTSIAIILCIFYENNNSLAIIVSSAVALIGSIIALPTIIAKHLFPDTIDDQIVTVVNFMLNNDCSIREAQINSIPHDDKIKK